MAFTAVLVSLCFYALPAFLPSILVTRRHMHLRIKLPPEGGSCAVMRAAAALASAAAASASA